MKSSKALVRLAWLAVGLVLTPMAATADEDVTTRVRHFSDSSTERTPAKTAFPKYPRIARRDRIEGEAIVCFRIDKLGRVRSARVRDASHRIFKRPALRAMRDSSFKPLQPDEILAAGRTCRTYVFRLEPVLAADNASDSRG